MIYFKFYYVIFCEIVVGVIDNIKIELYDWLVFFSNESKLVEYQCLGECICYDLEMMQELGYCIGIENYFCYFLGCGVGELFLMLFDYLFDNVFVVIDEFYVMVFQIGVMYKGDRLCKEILVQYGFCLFFVLDNWFLQFEEWEVLCL